MKEKIILVALFCCTVTAVFAQREISNPLVNSKEVLTKGVALHNERQYKAAIAEYSKVPESDTAYSDVLYEMILSYYKDSSYAIAEQLAQKGLSMFPEKRNEWYGILADLYDDTKREELALKVYDTILAEKPYSYITWFNKGISLFRQSKNDEAAVHFQRCIMLNPYYSSAHYFLGRLSLLKGNLPQAMMSFAANLLVMPDNNYFQYSIGYLNSIAEMNNTVTEHLAKYRPGKIDDFDMQQEIIASKAALDRKYKLKANLEDQLVRQLQVLLEKLEYNAADKGFWMQYYVPMYKNIWERNQFEPFVNYIFSELDIKSIKEYNKKEKKKVQAMSDEAIDYLNLIRSTQVLQYPERDKTTLRYYIQNYNVSGKGVYGKNAKKESILTGPWEFYHPGGNIKSKGVFDDEGRRNGEWLFYYDNGILREKTFYEKDKASGKSYSWYDNGLSYKFTTYTNDEEDGESTSYFYNGMLRSVIKYQAGKKEGKAKYYNVNGYVKTVTLYSNDLQDGEEVVYHADGTLQSKLNYTKDKANGEYKEYFNNGKLKISGSYINDKKTGIWKTYYPNGQQEYLENYTNGELDGEYMAWYKNGKIESKRMYIKGEIDGKKEDFDDDGLLYCESIFEKGRLRDIKFFDKKAQVISSTSSRKGNADITFFAPDGSKSSSGYYTKDGLLEGKGLYYYKNGRPSSEAMYVKGLLEGKRTLYYENGKVKQEGSFKQNEADGYFTDFYIDGEVEQEGWYVNGVRQGTLISRNHLGKLTSKLYYLNGDVHGVAEYYYPSGKLDYKAFYDNGWFYKTEQYDADGKVIAASQLNKGEGVITYVHFNGKPYIISNYKHYKLNGQHSSFNGDGSKIAVRWYKNGNEDSTFTSWHPNGKIKEEGRYKRGEKVGQWKLYYYSGQVSAQENYNEEGLLHGKYMQYNEDGSVDKEMQYQEGRLDGEYRMYSDKELALVFYYKEGTITGYSYEGKDGKLVPAIPLTKGAGKVVAYFKNGIKSAEMDFSEYLVEGPRNIYFTNGKEYITGQRVNGQEHGVKKVFYNTGKLLKEENFVHGKLHGAVKVYNENGTLFSELNYYLGDLHGECKYYTAGKPSVTYIYHYGMLESKK